MKTVRIYILIATLALVGRSVWAFDCITVFGDSLSDTGNFSLFTGGSFPPAPPYYGGPDPTFPVGRFSNGKVWVEYLADLLDVADPVPRGFEIDPTIEPISPCDTNYAWAGAVTGSEAASFTPTLAPYPSPPLPPPPVTGGLPVGLQIESYLLDFDYFCPESLECDLDDYLFIVWAGANDILIDVDSDVKTSVANLEKHLDDLINDGGAKHILIANLPMLTIVPAISAGVPSFFLADSLPETTEIEKRVHKFNSRLSKTLDKIENDHPNVTIYRLDALSIFDEIINNPAYTNGPVLNEQVLFGVVLDEPLFLADESSSLFWDGVHPTTMVHETLAEEALAVLSADYSDHGHKRN